MMYTFQTKAIVDRSEWNEYISTLPEANFLQSWEWGEFHQALGKKVFRTIIQNENSDVICLYSSVIEKAKRGRYITIAGGPLLDWDNSELLSYLVSELKKQAKAENVSFIRFRPQEEVSEQILDRLKKLGLVESPMHVTADLTLQLDLSKTSEELLMEMRKNTRYEIKRATKLGIQTSISTNPEDIKAFYDIQCAVAKRHNFVPFSYEFLYEQFKAFVASNSVAIISSYLDGKLLAQAFIIFYNKEAVYHYGISTEENAKLPGSYACQWRAIEEAQVRGCATYNFWGIAPENQPQHRFAGVSLFKRGFGGRETAYIPAHDIPVSPFYWITHLFERLRKRSRKL